MSKHILVLGATGPSGVAFCEAALHNDYTLTIYARNPSKLPSSISSHPRVTIIKGELYDPTHLEEATDSGAKTFVSFAGPVFNNKGTPITDGYKLLFPLLLKHKFTRVMILCTPSHPVIQDQPALKWKASVLLIKLIGGSAYAEMSGIGAFVEWQPSEQLNWTLFRVPFLTNGKAGPVKASWAGRGEDGMFLSRKSLARWVLGEIEEKKWVGDAPLISNEGGWI